MKKCPVSSALMLALALTAILTGCAGQIGSVTKQDAKVFRADNGSPTQVVMSDVDRGSLSSTGVGPGSWSRVMADGVETQSVGVTPRRLFLDKGRGLLSLDSGTDITAKGIELRVNGDGNIGLVKIDEFGTSASAPIESLNKAYPALVEYWKARDEASKQAVIAEIQAAKDIAPDVKSLIVSLLTGIP